MNLSPRLNIIFIKNEEVAIYLISRQNYGGKRTAPRRKSRGCLRCIFILQEVTLK